MNITKTVFKAWNETKKAEARKAFFSTPMLTASGKPLLSFWVKRADSSN